MTDIAEDQGNLLRERKHKIMHSHILRAVFDRTNDDSGTLRTRALVIMTKVLSSKHVPLINAIKVSVSDLDSVGVHSQNTAQAKTLSKHLPVPGPAVFRQRRGKNRNVRT